MRTIIHSNEAATASSRSAGSSPTCLVVARGVASAGPKLTQIYSIKFLQLLYAHYECCALSVSVHYVLGGCTLRRNAFHIFYFITLINFMIMLLTLWLFFIQIVNS